VEQLGACGCRTDMWFTSSCSTNANHARFAPRHCVGATGAAFARPGEQHDSLHAYYVPGYPSFRKKQKQFLVIAPTTTAMGVMMV
jgi:hypothetical protein